MAWFKVDDKLHDHRKPMVAGKAAMGIWVLAGSWASAQGNGGFVPARVLSRWGGTRRDAEHLVAAGLWSPGEHDAEPGWWYHDWEDHNPDADTVAAMSDGGSFGNHKRWHVKRKITVQSCPHCIAPESPPDSGSDSPPDIAPPSPPESLSRPVPSRPLSVVTSPSQSSSDRIGPDGLTRIRQATNGTDEHARRTADFILARANGVRDPLRYVLGAIKAEPELHRWAGRGNPTKATECRDHPGEWADACRIHAQEAKR